MTVGPQVLISGASIAGPALAFWLHRFGFRTTVVERSPGLRPGGQAVDIRGVAREVVRRMGLDTEVRAARTDTLGASNVTRHNRRVVTVTPDMDGGDGALAEIEILRGDLSEVLHAATEDTTEYLFGDHLVELGQRADGVLARFACGTERQFDLVIGADGVHSGVRSLVFGDGHLRHLGMYLAFFTVPNHLGLDRWALEYLAPGRVAGIRSIRHNAAAMAYFGFGAEPGDHDDRDPAGQRAIVRERMRGTAWEVPRLLAEMEHAGDFYFDSCTQVTLERWSTGRVALLGDAAFCPSPLSGQGTSLALVGAYVLAGELAAHQGDHASAFARYEARLRGFVEANQRFGRDNAGSALPTSWLGIWRGYLTARLRPYLPSRRPAPGTMLSVVNALDLPDYPLSVDS